MMCSSGASGSGSPRIVIFDYFQVNQHISYDADHDHDSWEQRVAHVFKQVDQHMVVFSYDADHDQDSQEQRVAHVFKQWISGQGLRMIQLTIKSTHRVTVSHRKLIKNHYSVTKSDL